MRISLRTACGLLLAGHGLLRRRHGPRSVSSIDSRHCNGHHRCGDPQRHGHPQGQRHQCNADGDLERRRYLQLRRSCPRTSSRLPPRRQDSRRRFCRTSRLFRSRRTRSTSQLELGATTTTVTVSADTISAIDTADLEHRRHDQRPTTFSTAVVQPRRIYADAACAGHGQRRRTDLPAAASTPLPATRARAAPATRVRCPLRTVRRRWPTVSRTPTTASRSTASAR